jgi:hypothetical protein
MTLLTRLLTRYWGYLALAVAALGYFAHSLGLAVVLALSLAALGYFLLQAPAWCGAVTRGGQMCRNNSTGLLLGCHLREHKWQKIRMAFVPGGLRKLSRGLLSSPKECLATVGGLASIVGLIVTVIPLALH